MDAFQRKGTVSRPSGPTYINSYALRGIAIKYAPPIYVPEILKLPAEWKRPQMFSEESFRYDYSGEQRVLEHGRQRAVSIAAQAEAASLRARMVEAARQAEKRQAELESEDRLDSPPRPPIIPPLSSTILTPIPAAATGSGTNTKDSAGEEAGGGGRGMDGGVNVIKSLGQMSIREFEGDNNDPFEIASLQAINDMEVLQSVLQPTVCTVASTTPSPSSTSTSPRNTGVISVAPPPSTQAALSQSHQTPTQVAKQPQVQIQAVSPNPAPTVVDLAAIFGTPPVSSSAPIQQQKQTPSTIQLPPPSVQQPPSSIQHQQPLQPKQPPPSIQQHQPSPPIPRQQPQPPLTAITLPAGNVKNPFLGGPLASSTTAVSSTNPFTVVSPVSSSQSGGHSSTNPFMVAVSPSFPPSQPPAGAVQEPSVGTLIEIEPLSAKPRATTPPVTRTAPVPVPRGHPVTAPVTQTAPTPVPRGSPVIPHGTQVAPVAVPRGQPATTQAAQTTPVPMPRGQPATAQVTQTAPIPVPRVPPPYSAVASPHTAQPQSLQQPSPGFPNGPVLFSPGSAPQPSHVTTASGGVPPIPPKPSTRGTPPAVPPKGIKVSQSSSGLSTTSSTTSVPISFPPVHNRLGLGVPVLPPIPHTSSAPHLSHSPVLEQPERLPTPPPPYFAEQEAETRRRPPSHPSRHPTYKLPDPKGSLSVGERKEVESITAMGFPSPRVARTIKRLGNEDRAKILDFLILVGRLEDVGYNGDSAETALLVSDEDFDKALDYLKRLDGYKDIGFYEKTIHEAYNKANGDWDQALDFLTQGR